MLQREIRLTAAGDARVVESGDIRMVERSQNLALGDDEIRDKVCHQEPLGIFNATARPTIMSVRCASQTVPMPPRAIRRITRYGPMVSGIGPASSSSLEVQSRVVSTLGRVHRNPLLAESVPDSTSRSRCRSVR